MSRGSDLEDHIAAVKPNGGPAAYPETRATTPVNGKTSSKRFEDIILSMAQVKFYSTVCLLLLKPMLLR